MIDSHFVDATRKLSKMKGGAPISVVDVDDHMPERAKEHNLCMVLLMNLCTTEIRNLLKDSETDGKRGNFDLLLCGVRFVSLLFATTYAVKYVRIAVEL